MSRQRSLSGLRGQGRDLSSRDLRLLYRCKKLERSNRKQAAEEEENRNGMALREERKRENAVKRRVGYRQPGLRALLQASLVDWQGL